MGRRPASAALMSCRALLTIVLVALLSAGVVLGATSAARADEPTPAPAPTLAPTIAASVSPPSQQQIDDARRALERLRQQGTRAPTTLADVAGPTAQPKRASVASRLSDQDWWTVGAALLVLLVASETTRLSVRRAKHRAEA
jgi:hypothetical protein